MTSASRVVSRAIGSVSSIVVLVVAAGCGRESTSPNAGPVPALTALNSVPGIPVGWKGSLGAPPAFVVGVQTASAHGGTKAAYLTNAAGVSTDTTFTTIDQFIQAGAYAGHRVRLSAWVRAEGVTLPTSAGQPPGASGIWMRIDGYGLMLGFDNMDRRPVVGTTGWQKVSVVLDVPTYALGIGFGALFSGSGELLVDDLVLETVSNSTPTTNMLTGEVPVSGDPEATVAIYAREPVSPANMDFEGAVIAAAAVRSAPSRLP